MKQLSAHSRVLRQVSTRAALKMTVTSHTELSDPVMPGRQAGRIHTRGTPLWEYSDLYKIFENPFT